MSVSDGKNEAYKGVPKELADYFEKNTRVAVAFSGGADSSYLLYAAVKCRAEVTAYYVKTAFQPRFELNDAQKLAAALGARLRVLEYDILSERAVTANGADRCYYCKKLVFGLIVNAAREDGYDLIIDGNNADDCADDRPGMRAGRELLVQSPLMLCGITKKQLREYSKLARLITWNKPAYACLATRIPCGRQIDANVLTVTEQAEETLYSLGFSDLRIRYLDGAAKIQLPEGQLEEAIARRREISAKLSPYYKDILIDLKGRG